MEGPKDSRCTYLLSVRRFTLCLSVVRCVVNSLILNEIRTWDVLKKMESPKDSRCTYLRKRLDLGNAFDER